jgi:hypothetical protein
MNTGRLKGKYETKAERVQSFFHHMDMGDRSLYFPLCQVLHDGKCVCSKLIYVALTFVFDCRLWRRMKKPVPRFQKKVNKACYGACAGGAFYDPDCSKCQRLLKPKYEVCNSRKMK